MDKILVLDFGSQYCHLISRRIRDLGVYSEVLPNTTTKKDLEKVEGLKGIILSGGAASVYDESSPKCDRSLMGIGVPILGICYGHQLISQIEGGEVLPGDSGEYGPTKMKVMDKNSLFEGLLDVEDIWMNHRDIVKSLPQEYLVISSTQNSPIAAFENKRRKIYGVQFHPEVSHTKNGSKMIENFVFKICNASKDWDTSGIADKIINEAKETVTGKAIIGLSGGVDSSTAAILINRAIGENLLAVYVDTGLMRQGETDFIKDTFSKLGIKLKVIDAGERFFNKLKGVTDPEEKRKIIGKTFIEIFDEVANQGKFDTLIQGTIYSDRIESGITKDSSKIKSHHNVGGLPENMRMRIYEPLRNLYKDEVRKIARGAGLPHEIIDRYVFPGPGLAVRVLGEVTPEKVNIVRRATQIVEDEVKGSVANDKVWMAFAVLLPVKTVGIQGDSRSYKYTVAVRIVESKDAMTANFAKVPYELLEKISTRITNEITEVNRVVYDISNKPPSTMEWE